MNIFKKTTGLGIVFCVLFVLGFLFAPTAHAGAITSLTVSPSVADDDDLSGNTSADWEFTINNETALSTSTDAVVITFPDILNGNWVLTNATSTIITTGGDSLQFATTSMYTSNKTVIIVATSSQDSANNDFTVNIHGVVNPTLDYDSFSISQTWNVKTCTLNTPGDASSGCASDIDSATTATDTIGRKGQSMDSWSYTPNDYSTGATNVSYTISLEATTALQTGDKIGVVFPTGFDITNASVSNQTIVEGGNAQITTTSLSTTTNPIQIVKIQIDSGSIDPTATSTITFTIDGIDNPSTKGSYGTTKVYTTNSRDGIYDGTVYGFEEPSGFAPPPPEQIQIGGTNTITGVVKVKTSTTTRTVTATEAAQIKVAGGCPDKQFFAGTKSIASDGTFTYNNLIDATYMFGIMPNNPSDSSFFESYLQPSMMQLAVVDGETATITPTFIIPDSVITGSITGGPANEIAVHMRAYNTNSESFQPLFNSTNYTSQGLDSNGTGYFKIKTSSDSTWHISFLSETTLTSGGTEYWAPSVDPIYIEPGKATTSPSAYSYVTASKTLNVKLQTADGTVIDENTSPYPCINVTRANAGIMGPPSGATCNTTNVGGDNVYQMSVPTGALMIEVMMAGDFKQYPVTIKNSDTTVSKTITLSRPKQYISGSVADGDSFSIQGASIMAQGSNGTFRQTLTDSNGDYTIYAKPGTYTVKAFAPGYGSLGSLTDITLTSGSNSTGNDFTANSSNFKKITGRVYKDVNDNGSYDDGIDSAYEGVQVHAFSSSGENGAMTRSNGTYTLRVPSGTGYTVEAWSGENGSIGSKITGLDATSDQSGQDFYNAGEGTLKITITDGDLYISEAFARAYNTSTGKGNGSDSWTATTSDDLVTTFKMPVGTDYRVEVGTPTFGNLAEIASNSSASTTDITANTTSSVTLTLPSMVNLSGSTEANASVWVSRTDGPGRFTTTADSNGDYSINIPDTYTYEIGANLSGYINTPVQVTANGSGLSQNITLTASSNTISGTISDSSDSSALSEGFVWAVKSGNEGWTGSEISADGSYTLNVDSGTWIIYAKGPCYEKNNGVSQTGSGTVNISLSPMSNCSIQAPDVSSISPSSGGTISRSDMSVNIPPNALGTGNSSVSVSLSQPSTPPPATLNASPISTSTRSIIASNSSGQNISTLKNSIEITMNYSENDIPSGSSEDNLQLAYWDESAQTWNTIAATVDKTNNTLTAKVNHLTDFAPVVPTGESTPDTPSGLSATKNGTSQVDLSWSSVTGATSYLLYRDTNSGGNFPYLTTISGNSNTTYSDTSASAGTTYYYKVSSSNDNGESSASSAVSVSTCSSISNGSSSGSSCSISCNSGYHLSSGQCVLIGGGGIFTGESISAPSVVSSSKDEEDEQNEESQDKNAEKDTADATEDGKDAGIEKAEEASSTGKETANERALEVSPVFNSTLKIGMTGENIKRLQKVLNSDPDTIIAETGVGSSGNETNYFGQLTKDAVRRFQAKYGIVSTGNEDTTGYGLVGPQTRAKIEEVFTKTEEKKESSVKKDVDISPVFDSSMEKGMANSNVKRLQKLLNQDADTRLAESGVGSPGNETDYFGKITENAVKRFQEKYELAEDGDPGYGYVGPATRAKIKEVFSQKETEDNGEATKDTKTEETTQNTEIENQINNLLKQVSKLQKQLSELE